MNTPVAIRKAISDKDKEEYRRTSRCFECGKQVHLARTCPSRKPRRDPNVRTDAIEDDASNDVSIDDSDSSFTTATLAALAMRLSDDEKETFARSLQEMGANAGFHNA